MVGKQRETKAAVEHIRSALEPMVVYDYHVDVFTPSVLAPAPYKFEREQLVILWTSAVGYSVCILLFLILFYPGCESLSNDE